MKIRKGKEMKVELDKHIYDKKIEIIENEIKSLISEINRARAGRNHICLEDIANQLEALQDFIIVSK